MITALAYLTIGLTIVFLLVLIIKRNKTESDFMWIASILFVQALIAPFVALAYLNVL